MSSLKNKFGKRIQQIRKSKHMTQEKLSELVGIDTPNLSNIERGKKFVTAETLEKIAKALDVNECSLFDYAHIEDKQVLIKKINELLLWSDERDVQLYYRYLQILKGL